jgi:hypothetical protein
MLTKQFSEAELNAWRAMRGRRVQKTARTKKPFKSGLKINTVRDIITSPVTDNPAFTFIEDDSNVECFRCVLVEG